MLDIVYNLYYEFVIFYAGKNFIRFNKESKTEGKGGTKPMKYELLIWGKLDLLKKRSKHPQADVNGWVKGHGFLFNINRINQLMGFK